jgi:shikimate kinase
MSKFPESPIALVGFMGSGKTTIGRLLADRLSLPFVDIDARIVEKAGMPIPEIFRISGESEFRKLESEMLGREAAPGLACVMACGGGIVEADSNRKILSETCLTIWLDIPVNELIRRLRDEAHGRPMLTGDLETRVRTLLERRNPLYSEVSSIRYDWMEGESPEASVGKILAILE